MTHQTLAYLAPFGFEIPGPVVVLGVVTGLTYGLLAAGLVLVYRSNRIINFAHGQIGAFAAAVFGLLSLKLHVPYYLNLLAALVVGGLIAAASELVVVRRLRNAPRLMTIVATLGLGQFLVLLGTAINSQSGNGTGFPQPPGFPVFHIGALLISRPYSAMLVLSPVVVVALGLFLQRSRFGIGIRSAAANPDAARMAGIFAGRMSSLAWALAGLLSTFTAILILPTTGYSTGANFGPGLLLRALAAAAVARMTSLPRALAAGVGLGVVEQVLLWNYPQSGLVEVALFVVIFVALGLQRRHVGRDEEKGSWIALEAWRPVPDVLRQRVWLIRHLGSIIGVLALAAAALLPVVATQNADVTLVSIMAFAVVGLSVGIITGLGGQLSLGQFALAAVGATISARVATHTSDFALAFVYAALGTAVASLLIGLPALRARGLLLTVSTLGFALMVPAWLLQQPWALGSGLSPGRPSIGGSTLSSGRSYYYFGLVVLVLAVLLARNVRTGGFGRLLVAIRDNEDNARAFSVRAGWVKAQAFLLAGALAGIGGALYGHILSTLSTTAFPVDASISVVAMAVIGGLSILSGPLLGALYIIGLPAFVHLDAAGLAATSLGWLLLILYVPGGVAQLLHPLREALFRLAARRSGIDVSLLDDIGSSDALQQETNGSPARSPLVLEGGGHRSSGNGSRPRFVVLEALDLHKRFGGVAAVTGVSLQVRSGETLGIIGPNGAGKTTLFEVLGGFVRPDAGRVIFDGEDVSDLGPEERSRLGLIRSFQDAALFPTMTVLEAVSLALERIAPTSLTVSVLGLRRRERAKEARARELVGMMGLAPYRAKQIRELSTGTRRIAELACMVALEPTLLLLDEPSSGIAQRETEALGDLLDELKSALGVTLVIIEHDIPLIMGLADRLVAMDMGRVIASGTPAEVRHNEQVVDAYLGVSPTAIERSGSGVSRLGRRPDRPLERTSVGGAERPGG